MAQSLVWCETSGRLFRDGRVFDSWSLAWIAENSAPTAPTPVTPRAAVARLFGAGRRVRRVPIAVIGPRAADAAEKATAEALGAGLAGLGLTLICGGKTGVMEAACKGHLEAGGLPIGLLPDEDWSGANPYVAIPLASGIGAARNAILARAALALVAVGGGYGTITEMAYGLHWDRPVFALCGAPAVPGAQYCADVEVALDAVAAVVLDRPQTNSQIATG